MTYLNNYYDWCMESDWRAFLGGILAGSVAGMAINLIMALTVFA